MLYILKYFIKQSKCCFMADNTNHQYCKKTFELFGDQWFLVVVNTLRDNSERFNCLQRNLNINTATLAKKLKRLEELGIIKRNEKITDNQSVYYELTAAGVELVPIIDQMMAYSARLLDS